MQTRTPRIAIAGAGFAGLAMGYYLKQAGLDAFTIYEKGDDVGGVWRENTYPGAACDAPSHLYSYSFEPHYPWSCRYGKQAEILEYQRHTARKHGLMPHVRLGREITHADFDAVRGVWQLRFADGAVEEAEVFIPAVGQLHQLAYPRIPGLDEFAGRAFHSARWDHAYDFGGKTIAVIGTGASAVQFVPEIAKQAKKIHVFQRSPGWVIPKWDRPFKRWERWLLDKLPFIHDLDRARIFWVYEYLASAFFSGSKLSKPSGAMMRFAFRWLLRLQVKSAELRARLTPGFPLGCKRTLLSSDWLATLALPHVEVVTEPIARAERSGLRTADGTLREVDAIVYGTGFAASQFLAPMQIRGRDGRSLAEEWKRGAEAYLGVGVSGFPNFFILYGPNTNIGGGSIIYMLEHQARCIARCVAALRDRNIAWLDVRRPVQDAFNAEVRARSKRSSYEGGCTSWYLAADGRNTNNWIGTMSEYARRLAAVSLADFEQAPPHAPAETVAPMKAAA